MTLKAIALNCTLKSDPADDSSTEAMIDVIRKAFGNHDIQVAPSVRVAALDIKPGVSADEGNGDEWPALRRKILDHDILILGGPIWMGQVGSVAKRVMERMDAFLSEADDKGRLPTFGKVAIAAIVGNEDGAHASSAQIFQALNDVGWTIPAGAACYWVGEAMGSVDFKDLTSTPEKVVDTVSMATSNAAHLARLLNMHTYPGV